MKWLMLFLATAFAQNMTPSSIQCTVLPRGLSGSWSGTTSGASGGFGGTCGGVSYNGLTGENLLIVNVPGSAPPGGLLMLDTCSGTTWDTEIIVSTPLQGGRCPTSATGFTCAVANDDACGMQSRVSILAAPGSSYAVIVTGFGTSSGPYTLTWSYNASTVSTGTTRSNTPSTRPTASNSFTPHPSSTSTPSGSPGPSWSSSVTAGPTFSPSTSMVGSPSSSTTITASETVSAHPSFTSSFTMRSSESSSPSMDESPSMSDTRTGTSSVSTTHSSTMSATRSASMSMSTYPTRTSVIAVAPESQKATEQNSIVPASAGLAFGIIITLIIVGAYYKAHKQNKNRRSVHLSPNIYFNSTPVVPENHIVETKNASFRTTGSPKNKVMFEPTPIQ